MRFSVWPSTSQPWSDVLAVATHGEATGWDGVYVADHFMGDGEAAGGPVTPMLEATAALSALAVATERVRLGSLVFGITYRHPAVLANWATTVDQISDGRLLLGVGAGWQKNEHEQYGIELGPPGVRIDRFVEALDVLTGLLREPVTNVAGKHYTLTDAVAEPKPVQTPLPILIGGKGDRMMGVVARYADEWNLWALPESSPSGPGARRPLRGHRPRPGHDRPLVPGAVVRHRRPGQGRLPIARTAPRPAVGGTVERLIEAVQGWADVGIDEVIVPDFTLGTGHPAARAPRHDHRGDRARLPLTPAILSPRGPPVAAPARPGGRAGGVPGRRRRRPGARGRRDGRAGRDRRRPTPRSSQQAPGLAADLRFDDAVAAGWVVEGPTATADGGLTVTLRHPVDVGRGRHEPARRPRPAVRRRPPGAHGVARRRGDDAGARPAS